MKKIILISGATLQLGERVVKSLLDNGAEVRVVNRAKTNIEKLAELKKLGVKIFEVNMLDEKEIAKACIDVSCVIDTIVGMHYLVLKVREKLIKGAVASGVPRLISLDFSFDFNRITSKEKNNFDMRAMYQRLFNSASISLTSIFNGVFAEILTENILLLDTKNKSVSYWGYDPDWKIDFTTMDNTASFIAKAALDSSTPRFLNIASFQISPNELLDMVSNLTKSAFNLIPLGGLKQLAEYNNREPEVNQNGQFMHYMFSTQHESVDNDIYPDLKWTGATEFIRSIL